ncbi:MAG TPA: hypothetical protein VGP93_11860, partial [Polyangiaceae bacterium]|nr:hypothetical protein [Polyangiaceae bacterium]
NISSPGETTISVRASAEGHAPRLVSIRIRRVENLSTELPDARIGAGTSYDDVASDPEAKRGTRVALEGSVLEERTENFATVVLLDVKSGCNSPPCVAKVTYGAKAMVGSGDPVVAVGRVVGAVDGPRQNTKIPAIAAELVVKAAK